MTRVLYIIKNLQQGGTEGQLVRLWGALPERFDKRLCLTSPEVHYDGAPPHAVAADPVAIARVIDEERPDLVCSFRDVTNVAVWRALRVARHQPAWLPSVRGRPVKPLDALRTRVICGRAHRVAVNSEGVAAVLRRFGVTNVALTPNLTDTGQYRPATAAERADARTGLGIADDAFVWALPARLSWVKNQLGLAAAAARLRRPFVLLLPGRARDSIPAWLLPRWARALGVGDRVRVLGPIADLRPIYAATDALVLASFAEGMPNVCLEAHLSALPIVVTAEANRDGIVADSDTGLVARRPTPGPLARSMAALMDLAPDARRAMGERGRARVIAMFDRGAVLARIVALYDEAVAARR